MTYERGFADCDKCGKGIIDEGTIFCEDCFSMMRGEIEEQREVIEKLQEENATLDERVIELVEDAKELERGVIE